MSSPFDANAIENAQDSQLTGSSSTVKSEQFQISGTTSPTDTGSFSGEESFLDAIGADFRTLACSLRETAGGVASFVQRSAMNVAAEIARLEEEEEVRSHHYHQNEEEPENELPLRLPWEVQFQGNGDFHEDNTLKERILQLSANDSNFLRPVDNEAASLTEDFTFDDARVHLIRHLLEIDSTLAGAHARLSGRSDVHENDFWKNYFDRCDEERKRYLSSLYSYLDHERSPNSLVQTESEAGSNRLDDELSFVLPTPPMSGNSTGIRSVDSFVFVDAVRTPCKE